LAWAPHRNGKQGKRKTAGKILWRTYGSEKILAVIAQSGVGKLLKFSLTLQMQILGIGVILPNQNCGTWNAQGQQPRESRRNSPHQAQYMEINDINTAIGSATIPMIAE
jgi:hypothetical protein